MRELTLYNFFPKHLNLYGDRGNIQVLVKRAEWRDIRLIVEEVTHLDQPSLSDADLLYMGGGGDREQRLISEHFGQSLSENIKDVIADGASCLAICGGYQLLGQYYETLDGTKIKGIQLFDYYTKAENQRLVGDLLLESEEYGTIIGFENHAGQTFHQGKPLGKVKQGNGNNGQDKTEGYQNHHFIGTYLHGPILPKNPIIADQLLQWAMERKYGDSQLVPLEDENEMKTKFQAIKRMEQRLQKVSR
jgi:CobQ-like glutamine amidotransferase family enzyme